MKLPDEIRRELCDLCWTLQDGSFSPADVERLERLAEQHPEVHALYAKFMVMCGALQWERKADEEGSGFRVLGSGDAVHPSSLIPHPSSIPPIIVDPSPTLHSPVGSFVFSHIAAAVILGIGLLIGLAWRISLPVPEEQKPGAPIIASAVARITALADCKWSKQGSGISKTKDPRPKAVYLGDRFVLSSGLMEITYDTGAKVILEGPCTYAIDSDRGGFLAVGRLTARVDQGSRKTHPSAFSLQPSALFAVRTPTAVVTDLGTEFGVEVEESGATRSHVFQGKVELVASGQWSVASDKKAIHLTAGQSARVERGRNNQVAITREPGQPDRFVRHIPSSIILDPSSLGSGATDSASAVTPAMLVPRMSPEAYAEYVLSLDPVAYYRMDRINLRDDQGKIGVFDSSPGGHHGIFMSKDELFMPYTPGLFGNAMSFRGSSMKDCVLVRGIPDPKDHQLTLTAWVKADAQVERPLVALRLGFFRNEEKVANGFHFGFPGTLSLHRWHHVAYVVHDQSGKTTTSVYLNGKCVRQNPFSDAWFNLFKGYWSIGGPDSAMRITQKPTRNNWQGQIDEFAMFNKALSPETIERLYLGGTPRKGDGVMKDP